MQEKVVNFKKYYGKKPKNLKRTGESEFRGPHP
jgi:hypothetical protein